MVEKYKIAVLAWERPNNGITLTGVGMYLNYLAKLGKFSRKNGCKLDLTFITPWEEDLSLREDGYKVLLLKTAGFSRKKPYARDVLYLALQDFADRLLGESSRSLEKFDLIFANSFAFGDFISRAQHLENVVYVSHRPEFLRESIAKKFSIPVNVSRLRRDAELEAKAVKNSSHVLVVSNACRQEFIKRYRRIRDRLVVIYNGVDTSLFKPTSKCKDGGKTVFTYVGRDDPEKGIRLLLESVRDLAVEGKNFELRLISNDGYSLRQTIERLGISEYIQSRKWERYAELSRHYSRAAFTVMPSYWESFSYVIAESLSCETPVIASAAGALPEIIGRGTGLLFKPGDKEDLTDKLRAACDLPREHVKKMGRAGRQRIRRAFSAERFLANYLKFIEATTNGTLSHSSLGED